MKLNKMKKIQFMLERTMHGIPNNNLECKVENPSLVVHYCKNIKAKKVITLKHGMQGYQLYTYFHTGDIATHCIFNMRFIIILTLSLSNQDMLGELANKFIFCKSSF